MGGKKRKQGTQQTTSKKLKTGKVFQDAVHGTIFIPEACMAVVDTPQFQRLRDLRQLGMVHMVYPSATHTRFEHCLGVCHLAGQLVKSLKEKQPELKITDDDVKCVQLAGLCHDIGHGPLGHFWEKFAKENLNKRNWSHEDMSLRLLDHLWEENSLQDVSADELAFIKAMIHKGGRDELPEIYKSKKFLLQIVANEETGIDVDKWDYFLRDSLHLGLKVTFDPQRFIEYSRVIEKDGKKLICYRDKMYREVLEMFQTRYELHCKAYQHKVVTCIDQMILDALCAEMEDDKEFKNMLHNSDDPETYTKLTDDVVRKLRNSTNEYVKGIFERIDTRQLYKCTADIKDDENQPPSSNNEKKTIPVEAKFSYGDGDRNPVERVYFYSKNDRDNARHLNPDTDPSLMPIILPRSFQVVVRRVIHKD